MLDVPLFSLHLLVLHSELLALLHGILMRYVRAQDACLRLLDYISQGSLEK